MRNDGRLVRKVRVEVGPMRVMVTHDDGSWFAQGIDLDYAAEGETFEDMKSRFESGLVATIQEHLNVYGALEQFIKPPPAEVLSEFHAGAGDEYECSMLSEFEAFGPHLRFSGIEYFQQRDAEPRI